MYRLILRMLIILTVIVILALPFQDLGSPEFIVSIICILFNTLAVMAMKRYLHKDQKE